MLEISRGCPFNCKFCQPGYVSLPYRECKLEELENTIENLPDIRKLALLGSSPRSYPEIRKVIKAAKKRNLEVIFCSNKYEDQIHSNEYPDDFKEKSIVLSPEAGTDSLRRVIGKKLNNSQLFESVEKYYDETVSNIRIYFMLGLPFETEADRVSIIEFVKEIRSRTTLPLYVHINPFIPKPWTAFQWTSMASPTNLREWMEWLEPELRKIDGVTVRYGNPREAHIRALLARGDHRTSTALEEKLSGVGWNTAFKKAGVNIKWVLEDIDPDTSFEWSFLNMGFGHTRLAREYHASYSLNQNRLKDMEKDSETEDSE